MSSRFVKLLRGIGKECERKSFTEAEIEKLFQERGFFSHLGYLGVGVDILAQRGKARKRYDVGLLGFGGRVTAVIEFKQPRAGSLDLFQFELLEKYVRPQLATFGVLTNGADFALYARTNGQFVSQLQFALSEVTESQAQAVETYLRKYIVDLDSLESVQDLIKINRERPLLIAAPESDAAAVFFQVFRLRPESAFGRLVQTLKASLLKTAETSSFTRGSYEFWLKTYARDLKFKDVPDTWKDFLATKSASEIAQFSFALETAYTIISRLILAKAADDRRFPGVRFLPRIQESLNELSARGRLRPEHYLVVVQRSFERAGETLFHSIFLQDIFDWWFECERTDSRPLFHALAEAMLVVTQFDFADLSGDLLGDLYQKYFDRDTRKALGEFYTPAEIIDFILDECGYKGKSGDRLLDPSCGSGSFLAAALRRFLREHSGQPEKETLLDLTEGLRIVGFDINPFAVLMAQVNYAALILPLYAEAINADRDFRIVRLPVFRTDSLRIEERETEWDSHAREGMQVHIQWEEATLDLSIYLPLKGEKKPFLKLPIKVPRYAHARKESVVVNLEEYVAALARVFQAARDKRHSLDTLLRTRFGERAARLRSYLQPALDALHATVAELQGKYNDGRFLKTIEDLVLAVSLKHDLQYDFVVGNPPYVRVQKIPAHVKEYWEGKYEWPERNYDLFIPFLERTVRSADREGWLGKHGRLGFILSNRFMNVEYGQRLREGMPSALRVDLLLDFRDTRLFGDALNYPAVIIAERNSGGSSGHLVAARVFSSDTPVKDLLKDFHRLRNEHSDVGKQGETLEVFRFPRSRLVRVGWWIMPEAEHTLLDKLYSKRDKLSRLTVSRSGAFQGLSTSGDDHLVFDELEKEGRLIRALPRHHGMSCGCGEKPIELERDALRPFLFGKDVARWTINWKQTWVLFPYDKFAKKRTLLEGAETLEEWNLIPSKANLDRFQFLHPQDIVPIEERFPKAWKYLRKHEAKLRQRENDRYIEGGGEAHLWYGATYPRGLDYYFRPKLVLQLLSRRNSFAMDGAGQFVFQAGGKGGGVYGVAFKDEIDARPLLAFLNSHMVDFLIKETSSVYGGRFYSYADQFLKDLPIAEQLTNGKYADTKRLAEIADLISDACLRRSALSRSVAEFPDSFSADLARFELNTIANLMRGGPESAQLSIERDAIRVEAGLYGFFVRYGNQQPFEFHERSHAECLARALHLSARSGMPLDRILRWRIPVRAEGCAKLLQLLNTAQKEIRRIGERVAEQEEELNGLIYRLYSVSANERKVIEDFLGRFSSRPSSEGTKEESN